MAHFVPSSTQKATFEHRYDSDGKVFINAIAIGVLTAKTPVAVIADEFGPCTKVIASGAWYCRIGVPLAAASIGDSVWLQHGGYCAAVTTASITSAVGEGIEIDNGFVTLVASGDYSGAVEEFAVCTEASGADTHHELMLVPRQILTST